jgi:hypothetical protein
MTCPLWVANLLKTASRENKEPAEPLQAANLCLTSERLPLNPKEIEAA